MLIVLILALAYVAWGWLVTAYIVTAALEISGIAMVVFDVRADRRKARRLMSFRRPRVSVPRARFSVQDSIDDDVLSRHGGTFRARLIRQQRERETERAFSQIASVSARSDAVILEALTDLLHGNVYRRLTGPVLIALGVLVGTAANVAAL
jgi:hypothetical protein